jgi:hypothetical protein
MSLMLSQTPALQESHRRIGALRQSMRALLGSVPGGGAVRTLLDVERVTGVHRKLAWQVHRLCQSGDSVAEARFIPSRAQLYRFVDAVVEHGGSADVAEQVRRHFDAVEAFVLESCGSWSSFESMVSDTDREASADITARHRQAMYEAACHVYGIRAATRFVCNIVAPSKNSDDFLDFVHIDGIIGLHRQRGTNAWPVNRNDYRFKDARGKWRPPEQIEVFDRKTYQKYGVAIVPEYCTHPMPEFELVRVPHSDTGQVLAHFDDVGRSAATDLVFGLALRRADDRASNPNELGNRADFAVAVELPCELLISDVLMHKSVDFGTPYVSTLRIDADLPGFQVTQMRTNELPVVEAVEEVGEGTSLLARPRDIPNYESMLKRCFEHVGLSPDEFRAYRCVVRHPIMSTIVSVRFA